MHRILLCGLPGTFRVMTIETDRSAEHEAMPGRRMIVNLVTTDTGNIASVRNNIAGVAQDVAIAGIQVDIIRLREINMEILKQVIARHEVVGIRKTAGFRFAPAQMALSADGDDLLGIARVRLREPHERNIVRMILRRYAVAGIVIERG